MESDAEPTAFPVGVAHFECTDTDRIDLQEERPRHFMVSVFYPGVPNEKKIAVVLADLFAPELREGLEALTLSHHARLPPDAESRARALRFPAQRELEPDRSRAPYPVLICSAPGQGDRFATASLCIQLARHGFVVFSVDHPHDARVVVYPDHSICDTPLVDESPMLMRVLDVACLTAHIAALSEKGYFRDLLDLKRIGALGHSRGGATAVASTFWVDQIGAGIDLDGYLFGFEYKEICGLEHYKEPFRRKVREEEKPILRLLGVPPLAGDLSPYFFEAESKVFGGPFIHCRMPGWSHRDFSCDRMSSIVKGEEINESKLQVDTLTRVCRLFFSHMLSNRGDLKWVEEIRESQADWVIKVKSFEASSQV
jgi:hypothetical protein